MQRQGGRAKEGIAREGARDDFADLARRQLVEPKVLRVDERVRALEKMLGRLLREDIQLHTELGSNAWRVRIDPGQLDQVLVNLRLLGWIDNDLTKLYDYCTAVSRATRVPIPNGYPVIGKDAFETATGVHAAAVIKALRKGDKWLADRVYSGVPAADFGREQVITIGPMSGKSNIVFWLEKRGRVASEALVNAVFEKAKQSDHILTDEEVEAVVRSASA